MFTTEEIALLTMCANNLNFTDLNRKMFVDIIDKIAVVENAETPSILVRIEGGSFDVAYGSQNINLIIEDADNIAQGGDLYYPCLVSYNAEILQARIEEIRTKIAAKEFKEIKITVHNPNVEFPFILLSGNDTIGQFKSAQEAVDYLIEEGIVW